MQSGSGGKVDPRRHQNATSSDVQLLESQDGSAAVFDFEPLASARSVAPVVPHSPLEHPSIHVRIQRVYLVLGTIAIVAIIAAFMWFCTGDGLRLETFESTDKDEPTRKKLLDKYNSISGNVVSVFIKPLEYFVAVVVALSLLCFATEFALSSHTTRYNYVLLALVGATGYLLSNGFNAINVQLAPRPIEAVVTADDLSLSAAGDTIFDIDAPEEKRLKVANNLANKTLLEDAATNAITNTVFRNWALPLEVNPPTQCFQLTTPVPIPKFGGLSALYRIPGRAWYSEALPVGLVPSKQLKFTAEYPSLTARVVPGSQVVELPMSRTRAMKLLVDATHNADRLFFDEPGWGAYRSSPAVTAERVFRRQFGDKNTSGMSDADYPTVTDLLLNDMRAARGSALSDADFVQVMANLTVATFTPLGVRGLSVDVDLTHFDLSPNLTFDAITVEFPSQNGFLQQRLMLDANGSAVVDPTSITATANSATGDQYFELDALTNCSLHGCALLDKSSRVKAQIIAVRACVDDPETDATRFKFESPYESNGNIICSQTSNTSLVVVSVGVRIEGDEISHATLVSGTRTRQIIRLKNARKVFSVTVGRLSWEIVDVAAQYGAECAGPDKSLCRGVRYTLAHAEGGKRRHVLVSGKRVPLDALSDYYYNFNDVGARYLPLVELPVTDTDILTDENMVLPRRFGQSSLPRSSDAESTACSAEVEDFLFHMEMNHLYIEKSLQPAYAAAAFFLFQDGVVRDEVDDAPSASKGGAVPGRPSTGASPVTLAFYGNRQFVDVRLSSPSLNILLTLVGCGFLLLLSVAVSAVSKASENRIERFADAHNVIEMLVDTNKYPSLLLEKTISNSDDFDVGGELQGNKTGAVKTEPLDENVRVQRWWC